MWSRTPIAPTKPDFKISYDNVMKTLIQNYKEPNYRQAAIPIEKSELYDEVIYEIIDINSERDYCWSMKFNNVLQELKDSVYMIEQYGFKMRPFIFMDFKIYKHENHLLDFIRGISIFDMFAMWFIVNKIVENC